MGSRSPLERGNFDGGERGGPLQSIGCTALNCAKMAEAIEMPFTLTTQVGPQNHELGGSDPPWEEAMLRGKRVASCKV